MAATLPILDVSKLEEINKGMEEVKRREEKNRVSEVVEGVNRSGDLAEVDSLDELRRSTAANKLLEEHAIQKNVNTPSTPLHTLFITLLQVSYMSDHYS